MRADGEGWLIATRNAGKTREFARLLGRPGVPVRSLADMPAAPDIVEDGETFAANAMKKARTIAEAFRVRTVADDSGLCVDRLDGRPGVYSARFAGEGATDAANNGRLLEEWRRLRERGIAPCDTADIDGQPVVLWSPARFVCALAVCDPIGGSEHIVESTLEGYVVDRLVGEGGFGYDPLFYVPDYGCTLAQLPLDIKNEISHRAKALRLLRSDLGET